MASATRPTWVRLAICKDDLWKKFDGFSTDEWKSLAPKVKEWYKDWCAESNRNLGPWPLYVFGSRDAIQEISNIGTKSLDWELERCRSELAESGSSKTFIKIVERIDAANSRLGRAETVLLGTPEHVTKYFNNLLNQEVLALVAFTTHMSHLDSAGAPGTLKFLEDMEELVLRNNIPGYNAKGSETPPNRSLTSVGDDIIALTVPAEHPLLNVRLTLAALCFGNFRFLKQVGKRPECLEWKTLGALMDYRYELRKNFKEDGYHDEVDTTINFDESSELLFRDYPTPHPTATLSNTDSFFMCFQIQEILAKRSVPQIDVAENPATVAQQDQEKRESKQIKKAKKNKKERERIKAKKHKRLEEAITTREKASGTKQIADFQSEEPSLHYPTSQNSDMEMAAEKMESKEVATSSHSITSDESAIHAETRLSEFDQTVDQTRKVREDLLHSDPDTALNTESPPHKNANVQIEVKSTLVQRDEKDLGQAMLPDQTLPSMQAEVVSHKKDADDKTNSKSFLENSEPDNRAIAYQQEISDFRHEDMASVSQSTMTLSEDSKARERAEKKAKDKRRRERRQAERASKEEAEKAERDAKLKRQEKARRQQEEAKRLTEEVAKRQAEARCRSKEPENSLEARVERLTIQNERHLSESTHLRACNERLEQQLYDEKANHKANTSRLRKQLEEQKAAAQQTIETRDNEIRELKTSIEEEKQKATDHSTTAKKLQKKLANDAQVSRKEAKKLAATVQRLERELEAEAAKTAHERREKEWQMVEVQRREDRISVDRRLLENAAFDVGILRSSGGAKAEKIERLEADKKELEAHVAQLKAARLDLLDRLE